MNKTTKSPGGVMVRVLATLNGFRRKHGYWPESLSAEAELICHLATTSLTPLGFFLLQSKVELMVGPESDVVARGGDDDFSYSAEGALQPTGPTANQVDARYWLGLDDDDFE